jgi:hypothetical protein
MRQAHGTTASEQPASTSDAEVPATSDAEVEKLAQRNKRDTRKARNAPKPKTVPKVARPRRPRGIMGAKVARLLAQGMTPPAIAKRLGISDVTVYYHRKRLVQQQSKGRALVPVRKSARDVVIAGPEPVTAEVVPDSVVTRRSTRVTSMGLALVLEAKKDAYASCWSEQRELTKAERKLLDAVDAFMGG